MNDMKQQIRQAFEESLAVVSRSQAQLEGAVAEAVNLIQSSLRCGGGLFVFGNGGSAADAQHIAAELVGRFLKERRSLRAQALSTDTSALTAIANDYGFEHVFARQLEGVARRGDVALAISTSGDSPNVVEGLRQARKMGLATIAMTGEGGGKCAALADVLLAVPARGSPKVQQAHQVIYHIICQMVELAMLDAGSPQ